ncbi:lipoyl(octanoyl) transferase LipB [Thioflexithrix psekupsensis]|uniref:lipoyl(octanoyl) transferase LipB n=1 Tax=Thioflexithrix psekupsensis TaxID=1570016 RepID=UPI003CC9D191
MDTVFIRDFGLCFYAETYHAMQQFTAQRDENTPDELWLVQHPAVYTLGQAGRVEHIIKPHDIPVFFCDRGGQVTYHAPGQLVVYVLMDLKRRPQWGVKTLVTALEQAIIDFLALYSLTANRRDHAPGVYVNEEKIASLGLRIRRGCSYHGLSLNIAMDLTPFSWINPCGYADLKMTQLVDLGVKKEFSALSQEFLDCLLSALDYRNHHWLNTIEE